MYPPTLGSPGSHPPRSPNPVRPAGIPAIPIRNDCWSAPDPPGTLTISSRIWNNQTPVPVDDETEMILSPQGTPGVWITDPMILVSDDVDDDHMFFGVADDMPNDRTHKGTIDSEVVARYYPFGMPSQTPKNQEDRIHEYPQVN